MVVRRETIPYPSSFSSPPPPPIPSTQESHHHIDTADVPPVPSFVHRSHAASRFEEMGNPWQDEHGKHDAMPDSLKAGIGNGHGHGHGHGNGPIQISTTSQNLPDALRPGRSGDATPRSSLDSNRSPEREWWDDDDGDDEQQHTDDRGAALGKGQQDANTPPPRQLHIVNDTAVPTASSAVKRKPLPQAHPIQPESIRPFHQDGDFASNNPFRRPSETFLDPPTHSSHWADEPKGKSRDEHPHPLRSSPSTDKLGNLRLNHAALEKDTVISPPTTAPPPPPTQAPPLIPQLQLSMPTQRDHDHANPWSEPKKSSLPPSTSSFDSSTKNHPVSTDHLLDRGELQSGSGSWGDELRALPINPTAPMPSAASNFSLLEDDEPMSTRPPPSHSYEVDDMYAPPDGPPPSHQQPPFKPPRPAVVTSERDLAEMREQRNETYQIKHFNWYDMRTAKMRRSSMLTQNKNGPCPLLALVNALILGATQDMQAALDDALRLREQVSLGLIIETLMDELISRAAMIQGLRLPDVDELNRFLMRLRTGMNANPRFVPPSAPAPNLMDADTPTTPHPAQIETPAGTFENTQDINLYRSFTVKLLHGWLPPPTDQAAKAFARSAQTYEDAQAVQFGEEELEFKLSSGGLTDQEQQLWEDITSIKQFFQAYPTQLTPYGLAAVHHTLEPGEFAILFRNDHFSTIFKHPRDGRLYTLITDAGYAERDEIIWESLEDINGARSEFFSGDFKSVSHGDTRHAMPHSLTPAANPPPRSSSNQDQLLTPLDAYHTAPALTPQEQQEQHDRDFAMALQMQEEEEQRARQARAQAAQQGGRGSGIRPSPPNPRPQNQPRRSTQGNIPIPLRSNPGGEVRPIIPPRSQRAPQNPAVNRPSDANDADAPPTYEVAARQTAYIPPVGSPLHPASSTDLTSGLHGRGSATTSTSNINVMSQTTGVTTGPHGRESRENRENIIASAAAPQNRRRASAYGENHENWQSTPDYSSHAFGPGYAFMSPASVLDSANHGSGPSFRRRTGEGRSGERDCVVM